MASLIHEETGTGHRREGEHIAARKRHKTRGAQRPLQKLSPLHCTVMLHDSLSPN